MPVYASSFGSSDTINLSTDPTFFFLKDMVFSETFLPEGGILAIGLQHEYLRGDTPSHKFVELLPSRMKGGDSFLIRAINALSLEYEFQSVYDPELNGDTYSDEDEDSADVDEALAADPTHRSLYTTTNSATGNGLRHEGSSFHLVKEMGACVRNDVVWVRAASGYAESAAYVAYGNEVRSTLQYLNISTDQDFWHSTPLSICTPRAPFSLLCQRWRQRPKEKTLDRMGYV